MMKKILILMVAIIITSIVLVICYFTINNNTVIFEQRFYYAFGSEGVKIYESGIVKTDIELEEPNHKEDYKVIRKLSKKEVAELKNIIKQNLPSDEFQSYINLIIHENRNYNLTQ